MEDLGLHPLGRLLAAARIASRPRQAFMRRRQWQALLRHRIDEMGTEVAELVALVSDRWGQAPTKREVGHAMGWSWWQRCMALRSLVRSGWLVSGITPRSLHVGPKASGSSGLAASNAQRNLAKPSTETGS